MQDLTQFHLGVESAFLSKTGFTFITRMALKDSAISNVISMSVTTWHGESAYKETKTRLRASAPTSFVSPGKEKGEIMLKVKGKTFYWESK